MLKKELRGESYNKSTHRRLLRQQLITRSDASVEKKHQNISAVLLEARFPYIRGYKPLSNYQALLSDIVLSYLEDDFELAVIALRYVEAPAETTALPDVLSRMVAAPIDLLELARSALNEHARARKARRADYLAIEGNNRRLGLAGEHFVVAYERARLVHSGCGQLAARVEHVAQTQGDGLGFDVLSFSNEGREKFIEVKTTRLAAVTPFYLSVNEIDFSKEHPEQFSLYRVFDYETRARLFALEGSLLATCEMRPNQFVASPRAASQ